MIGGNHGRKKVIAAELAGDLSLREAWALATQRRVDGITHKGAPYPRLPTDGEKLKKWQMRRKRLANGYRR